jgi:hypothetical protein
MLLLLLLLMMMMDSLVLRPVGYFFLSMGSFNFWH